MPSLDERPATNPLYPSWKNPWVILAAFLIAGFILFGVAAVHVVKRTQAVLARPGRASMMQPYGAGGYVRNPASNGSIVEGVVTAANTAALTVAGNGTTSTVSTTSSTQYQGGSQAAVNDTVIVTGTTTNGTFTATKIVINP